MCSYLLAWHTHTILLSVWGAAWFCDLVKREEAILCQSSLPGVFKEPFQLQSEYLLKDACVCVGGGDLS